MIDTADILSRYRRDGYVFPLRAMSARQARQFRRQLEQAESQAVQRDLSDSHWQTNANFLLPFVFEIATLPAVVAAVSAVLGPDLLLWRASFFIKEPISPDFVSWHQDLTYWGLDGQQELTAWIALSPATAQSGCMRFVPGSHKHSLVKHRDTVNDANLLSRGQMINVAVDERSVRDIELAPGQMSLHHGHLFHASRPNESADRRIGLALRFITPAMRQVGGEASCAQLVSGQDREGHFTLVDPPERAFDESTIRLSRQNDNLLARYFNADAAIG